MCATNICVQKYIIYIYFIHFCRYIYFYAPIFVCISLPTECFLKVKFLNLIKRQVWPMHLWANPKTLPSECRPEYRHRCQKNRWNCTKTENLMAGPEDLSHCQLCDDDYLQWSIGAKRDSFCARCRENCHMERINFTTRCRQGLSKP